MGKNAHYWTNRSPRAEQAVRHTEDMAQRYADDITACVSNTRLYDGTNFTRTNEPTGSIIQPKVWQATTDGALFTASDGTGPKTALLNFASYKNPGGMFIEGSMAQEEAICHKSFLYNVLSAPELASYYEWNNKHLNKGLYLDRALYTPGVVFEAEDGGITRACRADVLTCAAPNNSMPFNVPGIFSEDQNREALHQRICFVRDILLSEHVDRAILGAWGCGVFSQDPAYVSKTFMEEFRNSGIECIYAVPDIKTFSVFETALSNELAIEGNILSAGEEER